MHTTPAVPTIEQYSRLRHQRLDLTWMTGGVGKEQWQVVGWVIRHDLAQKLHISMWPQCCTADARSLTALTADQDADSYFALEALLMAHACELSCMYDVVSAGLG